MTNFYVYVLLDPRKCGRYVYGAYEFDCQPFYVGKGKDERCYEHVIEAKLGPGCIRINYIRGMLAEGVEPIAVKLHTDLTEEEAFALEVNLIAIIGRRESVRGPLTNMSDGGEGQTGFAHSEETKRRVSERLSELRKVQNPFKGKHHTEEAKRIKSEKSKAFWGTPERRAERAEKSRGENNPNYGNKWSDEQRQRMSQAKAGIPLSEQAKTNIGKSIKEKWQDPDFRKMMTTGEVGEARAKAASERWQNPELRARMSDKGRRWKVLSPEGEVFETNNLKGFCRDRGLAKSASSNLSFSGKWRGWTANRIEADKPL